MRGLVHLNVVWIKRTESLGGVVIRRTVVVLWIVPVFSWDRDIGLRDIGLRDIGLRDIGLRDTRVITGP